MGVRRCVVKDCLSASNRSQDIGVTFHKVPDKVPETRAKWLELCKVEKDTGKWMFVCSRHFFRNDFAQYKTKYALRPSTLPSIFLWNRSALKKMRQKSNETDTGITDNNVSTTDGNLSVTDKNTNISDKSSSTVETNTSTPDSNTRTKRIRKKKVIPDYFTDEDMRRKPFDKEKVELVPGEKAIDFETSVKADVIVESGEDTDDVLASPVKQHEDYDKLSELKLSTNVKQPYQTFTGKTRIIKRTIKRVKKGSENVLPIVRINEKSKEQLEKKTSIIKDKIVVEEKLSPAEIKQLEVPLEKIKDIPGAIKMEPVSVKSDSLKSKESSVQSKKSPTIEVKNQTEESTSGQLTFELNARIEALDFNQTWSPATIIEVDYEGTEVLVRFDSCSNQYAEWIRINSSSIRLPSSGNDAKKNCDESQLNEVTYEVGEPCMAYWIDAKKFPGVIKEIIDHETYVVEFDDGYVKTLNASKMTKSSRSLQNSPLFLPVKSTKEERRKRKRKLNVQSLFKKRMKTKSTLLDSSAILDDSSYTDESLLNKSGYFDTDNLWYPSFENGRPVGIRSSLKSKIGFRESTIVPDPRLPEDWEKHVLQREGGKWYSLIIAAEGRKLRGPADVQRYINDHPSFNYKNFTFDFNISPRHSRPCFTHPKIKPQSVDTPDHNPPSPSLKNESLIIAQVDGVFHCPIDGCDKKFRRENLVQMHVKHYHPEFKKFLGSTPNVLDLVYKRLRGEDFDQTPTRSYDHSSKRASYTPTDELANINANDMECQKDSEIKKLLNSTPYDTSPEMTPQGSGSFSDIKLRDILMDSGDPDLKSLVVTTKSGLKTIPPVKKDYREDGFSGDWKESRKRKIDDLYDDHSGSGMLGENDSLMSLPPTALDHIIGEDGKMIKIEHMRKEEIINCTCGITEEDGLMIQCELCLCWQHAHCNNIYRETEVPEKYVCYICMNPLRQRTSMKYKHDQDWLKHGTLPTGSYHYVDEEANQKRFDQLRISHDISGGLIDMKQYMHSLKLKIKIAELKNHPKLYLWSKPWEKSLLPERQTETDDHNDDTKEENLKNALKEDWALQDDKTLPGGANVPQPEAAIETADCRLNLLDHLVHCQSLIEERLNDFAKKIDELDGNLAESKEDMNNIRPTTIMLLRDMNTLKEFSELDTF